MRRWLRAAMTLVTMTCAGAVVAGSPGTAAASEPTGDFARFAHCPRFAPGVNLCIYGQVTSGEMIIGGRTVTFRQPLALQGGVAQQEEPPFAERFVGALNGETLSRTPIPVPGGLAGSPLYVILELAAPASTIAISKRNLLAEEGTAVSLPARLHLESRLLGGECYIGSASHPVELNLTTGTTSPYPPNRPISGHIGEEHERHEFALVEAPGTTFVDNSFALPAATGCGGRNSSLIDQIVDQYLGLPSPGGRSTIIEYETLYEATTLGVIASER